MKTDYRGIDYSLGRSNKDQETGIHYGVIPANSVGQAWYDDAEPYYLECDCDEWNCECGPRSFFVQDDEIEAEQSSDDTDIFILKSRYYTWAQFCSPFAPGAGYILNWTDPSVGVKAYCLGHDWFEDGKAPYPVYSVETDELVEEPE